jgi:mutator protein MutT
MEFREDQEIRINNMQSRGFVIKDNKILVMFRKKNGEEYYVFPGGHMQQDETPEETVVREIEEETTIKCRIIRKAFDLIDYSNVKKSQSEFYFICKWISGDPKLSGEESRRSTIDNYYEPMWINLLEVNRLKFYPAQSKQWVMENIIN